MSRQQHVLAVVAAGGAIGSLVRASVQQTWVESAGTFPWVTLGINIVGCFCLGMLTVLAAVRSSPWWVTPFLGTGLLGGFTTFSAYVVWAGELALSDNLTLAVGYVALTPAICVSAAWLGAHAPGALGMPHGHAPLARTQE
ncbi:MAG: CrcB family protein [Ornithinimicrobium sp.]